MGEKYPPILVVDEYNFVKRKIRDFFLTKHGTT
jgi:hypothetical protein